MTTEDFIQPPCSCPECHQAGVSHLRVRRDPYSGRLLHGYSLRRWYEAQARFMAELSTRGLRRPSDGAKAMIKPLVARAQRIEDENE